MRFLVTKRKEIYMMSMEKKDFKEVEECMELTFFLLCLEEVVEDNKDLKKVNPSNTQ
jgi:hypothetical protein